MKIGRTIPLPDGRARVLSRSQLAESAEWPHTLTQASKDHRYYELLADTLTGFEYEFLALEDSAGEVRAIQPIFFVRQNICEGLSGGLRKAIDAVQRRFPRFLTMKTLMVGCTAGEGHLGASRATSDEWVMLALRSVLRPYARSRKASLVVLKDFSSSYRAALGRLAETGYTRIPSMPMTRLKLRYEHFEEYLKTLGAATRKNLRRKFRETESAATISLEVVADAGSFVGEIYPLYLQVHERSTLKFERLSKEYFRTIGSRIPDRTRFFIWRQNGKIIAFSLCVVHDGTIYDDYLGLDYRVAYDLNLYYYTFRDIVRWSIAQGLKNYCSSPLNYEPKFHLHCELKPLDLYVLHTSPVLNALLRRMLPLMEPTRGDRVLQQFPNAHELKAEQDGLGRALSTR